MSLFQYLSAALLAIGLFAACKSTDAMKNYSIDVTGRNNSAPGLQRYLYDLMQDSTREAVLPPGVVLYLKENVTIPILRSIDFNGAVVRGAGRLVFVGSHLADTSWFTLQNLRFAQSKGVVIERAKRVRVQQFRFEQSRASALTVRYSQEIQLSDLSFVGTTNAGKDKIACLLLHCINSSVDGLKTTGGDWFVAGVQVKGGQQNTVRNAIIENANFRRGFFARGDAPYKASPTKGDYPYATGNWNQPDRQRETRRLLFEQCTVINSSPNAWPSFLAQEARDVVFRDCSSINSGKVGFAVHGVADEDEFSFINCTVDNELLDPGNKAFDLSGAGLQRVVIRGADIQHAEQPVVVDKKCVITKQRTTNSRSLDWNIKQ